MLSFLLRQNEPLPIEAVVESVRRVKSAATVTIGAFERHGHLRQFPSETDARVTYGELTAKGRRLRKDFEEVSQTLLRELCGDRSEKERAG